MGKAHVLTAVQDFLRAQGVQSTVDRGKHFKVRFEVNGHRRSITCSVTASDPRSAQNAVADARRILRDAGLSPR